MMMSIQQERAQAYKWDTPPSDGDQFFFDSECFRLALNSLHIPKTLCELLNFGFSTSHHFLFRFFFFKISHSSDCTHVETKFCEIKFPKTNLIDFDKFSLD